MAQGRQSITQEQADRFSEKLHAFHTSLSDDEKRIMQAILSQASQFSQGSRFAALPDSSMKVTLPGGALVSFIIC